MHKLNEAFSNQGAVVSIISYSTMNDGAPAQLSGREVWPSRNVRPTFSLNWQLSVSDACLHFSEQSKRKFGRRESRAYTWWALTCHGKVTHTSSWPLSQPSLESREVHLTHSQSLPLLCPPSSRGSFCSSYMNQTPRKANLRRLSRHWVSRAQGVFWATA